MEVAIHLPDDVAAAVPWEDVPRHLVEKIALEGYQEGWLSEEQVRRILGYEIRLEVHGFLKEHGVYLRYTVEDLERDRAAHEHLGLSCWLFLTPPPSIIWS
jgi:predicted HTH domain antitoxin